MSQRKQASIIVTPDFADAVAKRCGIKPNTPKYKAYTIVMWRAAKDALKASAKGAKLDPEIAAWLAHIADELLSNRSSAELDAVRSAGGAKDTSLIADAKETAVVYYQAVASKDIEDKSPNKTLSNMFGCGKQTIRDWVNYHPKDLWANFHADLPLELRVKRLGIKLKHSGRLIAEKSQAQKAISHRHKGHG